MNGNNNHHFYKTNINGFSKNNLLNRESIYLYSIHASKPAAFPPLKKVGQIQRL
ncbi:hypothetical protein SB6421_00672 [Klebsiella huaxiensis]|uniref:Uncharacterized protein n=1 Tax=Klebsiella huaxiensis TaxID=2153354 RepID=A0A564N297_9ENTR|nr:hypothetical protein SB6422_01626 [Klebsiella huaxiensis]VUT00090.1 hypothetical protein SB6421_00672 [Klebsiella huaxiensis]